MSKAGGAAEEVPVASTSAAAIQRPKESRKLPFQYAGFYPPPPLNTKCEHARHGRPAHSLILILSFGSPRSRPPRPQTSRPRF